MSGVLIVDRGEFLDIEFLDPARKADGLQSLLAAAAQDGSDVQVRTGGRVRAFRVTRTVAQAAGFLDEADKPDPVEPEQPTEPAELDEPAEPASDDAADESTETVDEPPRTGKGSGRAVWLDFLEANHVDVPDPDASRDHLIAVWDGRDS